MKVIQGSLWPIHKRTVHGNCPQWSSGGCSYQQGSVCAVHKGNARDNCTQGSTVGRCCPQGSMRTVHKQTAGGNCSQGSTGGRCCPQWSMRAVSFHKGIPIYKIKPTSKEEILYFQVNKHIKSNFKQMKKELSQKSGSKHVLFRKIQLVICQFCMFIQTWLGVG